MNTINPIDLEMSIINKNDTYIIDFLCECISDEDTFSVLEECAVYPLLESTEYREATDFTKEYNELKKELKSIGSDDYDKQTGVINKITSYVKRLYNWWFKAEPDKKFKTLRLVIKILLFITMLVITYRFTRYGTKLIANHLLPTPHIGAAARKIGYKGVKKIPKKLFSAEAILRTVVSLAFDSIQRIVIDIYYKCEDKVNLKDIDANIEAYDHALDKLNNLMCEYKDEIDEKRMTSLKKQKSSIEDTLAKLIKIKVKHQQKDNKSDTK